MTGNGMKTRMRVQVTLCTQAVRVYTPPPAAVPLSRAARRIRRRRITSRKTLCGRCSRCRLRARSRRHTSSGPKHARRAAARSPTRTRRSCTPTRTVSTFAGCRGTWTPNGPTASRAAGPSTRRTCSAGASGAGGHRRGTVRVVVGNLRPRPIRPGRCSRAGAAGVAVCRRRLRRR